MKKILAVLVSVFWLALIVGIPALVLSGNAGRFIPAQIQDQLTQLVGQDLLAQFNIGGNEPTPVSGEPIVLAETVTPAPTAEPTATPTEPPAPTPTTEAPPTATPQPELTNTPVASLPEAPAITIPVAVRGQAELRTGPGLNFDAVGLVDAGATILVSAQDETGEWFLIDNGNWIPGEALASKPAVPIVLLDAAVTPEATPTDPPLIEATATPATPVVVKVNADSNLRSGPGGTFDRVGGATLGSEVTVVGKLATDNWYLLESGAWIFGELLESAPDVPQVNADGTPVGGIAAPLITASTPITPSTVITPSTASAATPTANTIANLRAAPTITATVTGSTQPGQALSIVGKNAAGDWLKLENGSWIFAELVDNAPANLPVVAEDAAAVSGNAANPAVPAATTPITETVAATPAVGNSATITPTTSVVSTAAFDAFLRAGPGKTFDIVGSITVGTALKIVGRNEAGDWLKLDSNVWIFGELVANPPADLPVVTQ